MLRRVLSSPALYCGWALVVAAALAGTYPVDPYVFGFTALGLAWLTGAVVIAAVAAMALWAWEWSWSRRLLVVTAVAVAVGLIVQALAVLRTFSWT